MSADLVFLPHNQGSHITPSPMDTRKRVCSLRRVMSRGEHEQAHYSPCWQCIQAENRGGQRFGSLVRSAEPQWVYFCCTAGRYVPAGESKHRQQNAYRQQVDWLARGSRYNTNQFPAVAIFKRFGSILVSLCRTERRTRVAAVEGVRRCGGIDWLVPGVTEGNS